MNKVLHLKLTNGEEIIGKECEENDNGKSDIVLKRIRILVVQPMGQGQMGLGMIPFMVGNPDGPISIPLSMILGDPVEGIPKNLEDSYLQQVSGLTFATNGNSGIIES